MKAVLLSIIILHGLIHFMGFINRWNLGPLTIVSDATLFASNKKAIYIARLLWLAAFLLFLTTATVLFLKMETWWVVACTAILVSQVLIILSWKHSHWGSLVNGILFIVTLVGFADWNFNQIVKGEVKQILSSVPKAQNKIITPDMLLGLPHAVNVWLTNSGIVGKQRIQTVHLKQKGLMRTKPDQVQWLDVEAEQFISIDSPAFVWQVKMNMMSLLPVRGLDMFVAGKGHMNIKLFSFINMVNAADEKIDQGALQRFLAEIGWYPSAAISPYIKWEGIGDTSARATMTYRGVSGSVLYHFNKKGDIISCHANRYMGGGEDAVLEKWIVRSENFATLNGINIPVKSEATWQLPQGDFTWYKLEISQIEYNIPIL